MNIPEFLTYDWMGEPHKDLAAPRIGTLRVLSPLKDAHYQAPCPLDDEWGEVPAGDHPLYAKYSIAWDESTGGRSVRAAVPQSAFATGVRGMTREGKPFDPGFQIYAYEIGKYLSPTPMDGGIVQIVLDPPFRMEGGRLEGYDKSWLAR